MSNKYSQNILDSAKKSTIDAVKTASKRAIQKTEKAFGDLIDNTIADEITSISKCLNKLHSKQIRMKKKYQKKDIYLQKKDNKLLMN